VDEGVVVSLVKQNCDYCELAFLVRVHEVYHHLISLAVDLLFAGPVKVELFEFVLFAAD